MHCFLEGHHSTYQKTDLCSLQAVNEVKNKETAASSGESEELPVKRCRNIGDVSPAKKYKYTILQFSTSSENVPKSFQCLNPTLCYYIIFFLGYNSRKFQLKKVKLNFKMYFYTE